MWKAAAGTNVNVVPKPKDDDDDDWETDADFVVSLWFCSDSTFFYSFDCLHCLCVAFQNDISEKEQRWGSKTIEGSGHQASIE